MRLPSHLLGRVVGPFQSPSSRKSRAGKSHRRKVDTPTAVWQAVWGGFVASGLSQQAGCWEMRKWVTKCAPRGTDWLCLRLKDLGVTLRDVALTNREVSYTEEVPRRLQAWLRSIARRDPRRVLAFTRYARALPKSSKGVVMEAYTAHLKNIAEPIHTDSQSLESLEQYVATRFGNKLRKRTWISLPSSKNSVQNSSGSKGGYDAWIRSLCVDRFGEGVLDGRMWDHARGRARLIVKITMGLAGNRPAAEAAVLNRLLRTFKRGGWSTYRDFPEVLQCLGTLLSLEDFRVRCASSHPSSGFVHQATALAEQGAKVRVITVPPGSVFTAGDRVRERVFTTLRRVDSRLLDFEKACEGGALEDLVLRPGEGWLSADLTKATDGFSHSAIKAVLRGLERAGLAPYMLELAAESLGVGENLHYVSYQLSNLTDDGRTMVEQNGWIVDKTKDVVFVPMRRGCLMGTPLSFTILSLINGWCCEVLGPRTHICGDDVISACTPTAIRHYKQRVTAVGSGMHDRKSFFGTKGGTFCETFILASGATVGCVPTFFNPYPIKQFMRDGNGVMDKGKYFAAQWSSLHRVARVLMKPVRAKARRLLRPPELPVALGGLGHPGKGMRSIPKVVRAQLYALIYEGVDPSKFVTRVDVFHAPANPKAFARASKEVESRLRVEPTPRFSSEAPPAGRTYVPNRALRRHLAVASHQFYWATGNKYNACKPSAMKPGKAKLPTPSVRQFSKQTPFTQVLDAWADKLDREGRWVPTQLASKILGVQASTTLEV
uniref:RNA-dependent RNA polymerase n=1 Tax=Tonghua Narna tick virus 3 TaxID=2972244 RepID=A0A9E7V1Y5_9VIRU|nr:MAG: RNA-dependent RNA polymerase [Tonghua Narna tick virus 3]